LPSSYTERYEPNAAAKVLLKAALAVKQSERKVLAVA